MLPLPISPYGASKLAVEGYLSAFAGSYGFSACSLRFSNVYGPRSFHKGSVVALFFKKILRGMDLEVFGDGTQVRDYVHTTDLSDGIISAIEKKATGVYQLGSGKGVSLNALLGEMEKIVGKNRFPAVRYGPFRKGEIHSVWCDIQKSKKALDFVPRVSLETGLASTWQWFCENSEKFPE